MKDKDLGIFCFKDRRFYIYEPGPMAFTNNSIERVRQTLVARELIDFSAKFGDPGSYEVMPLARAKMNEYPIEILYPSEHVKKLMEARSAPPAGDESDGWYGG